MDGQIYPITNNRTFAGSTDAMDLQVIITPARLSIGNTLHKWFDPT